MSDVKIFLMCVAWLSLASLILTFSIQSVNFSYLHDIKYSNVNRVIDLVNTTSNDIKMNEIVGRWQLKDGYIFPSSLGFFGFGGYNILEFGSKFSINDALSEKMSITGINYNVSDTFGISVIRGSTYNNEIFLEFYGIEDDTGILSCLRIVEQCPLSTTKYRGTTFAIAANVHTVNVSYTYFRLNKTLTVYCEEHQMFKGIVDTYSDLNINVAGGNSYYYESLYHDFNRTEKSRIGTNIPTFKLYGYTQNTITSYYYDNIEYTITSNPLDFLNTLFSVLTFNIPSDINNQPLIPYEFQFLLIGLPYLAIAGWIITAIVRGS